MNRSLLLLALTSCLCGCQNNGQPKDGTHAASESDADIRRTVDGLAQQHTQGLLKKDLAALDRLWADDFTFIDARGRFLTKAQRLDNLRSGTTAFKSIDVSEVSSRALGNDAAVTTSRAAINGQYSGQEGSGDYRATFVWGRRQGTWKLVTLQMTRIEK